MRARKEVRGICVLSLSASMKAGVDNTSSHDWGWWDIGGLIQESVQIYCQVQAYSRVSRCKGDKRGVSRGAEISETNRGEGIGFSLCAAPLHKSCPHISEE